MNLFDLVAGLVLLVSAGIGFHRGAVTEVVALFAFTAAAAASVYLLPYTAPIARQSLHPAWIANTAATGAAFLIAYVGLRLVGAGLSRAVRSQATLGSLDRTVGFAFGVTRALIVLGVVYLVFSATPGGAPPVLTQSRLFPLARGSGVALASLAPGGVRQLQGFGQSLKDRMASQLPQASPADEAQASDPPASAPAAPPYPDDAPPATRRTLRIEGGRAYAPRRSDPPSADSSGE